MLAVYWDDKCFNVQDEMPRMDMSECEGFRVEPAHVTHWNSTEIIEDPSSESMTDSDPETNTCKSSPFTHELRPTRVATVRSLADLCDRHLNAPYNLWSTKLTIEKCLP